MKRGKESLQRQYNRSTAEERHRAYTQASKAIRDKLALEKEKRLNAPSARR